MGFSLLRRFLRDQSGTTFAEYILITAAATVLAAFFLSASATFSVERANIIQRLMTSPGNGDVFGFEDK
jgi:Flp pilus assembly pilin Flp